MLSVAERKLIVRLHNKGKKQQEIADLVGCAQSVVHRWVTRHKRNETLESRPRSGRPSKLKDKRVVKQLKNKILKTITAANENYSSVSTKKVGDIIREEIGEAYSLRHVERIMHMLGFSLITPRPQHLKHDQEKVDAFRDEFKKNSKRSIWGLSSSLSTR